MSEQVVAPARRRIPVDAKSITHKFCITGHAGFISTAFYEDGKPCMITITMRRENPAVDGFIDSWASAVSMLLQYGVPLEAVVVEFDGKCFPPAGYTETPPIPIVKSIVDYVAKYLSLRFLGSKTDSAMVDLPLCANCGHMMVREGNGFKCLNCETKIGRSS